MSISTGVEKKRDAIVCSAEVLSGSNELDDPRTWLHRLVIPPPRQAARRTACFPFIYFNFPTSVSLNVKNVSTEQS